MVMMKIQRFVSKQCYCRLSFQVKGSRIWIQDIELSSKLHIII